MPKPPTAYEEAEAAYKKLQSEIEAEMNAAREKLHCMWARAALIADEMLRTSRTECEKIDAMYKRGYSNTALRDPLVVRLRR